MYKLIIKYVAVLSLLLAGCAAGPSGMAIPPAQTESCRATSEREISSLFDLWNRSLQTGDPRQVVARYAEKSVLLPTVSSRVRFTQADKEDYFHHFLENRPAGKIDSRTIQLGCNTAVDIGLYTFTYARTGEQIKARYTFTYRWNGRQWLITSHHSSVMPEKE